MAKLGVLMQMLTDFDNDLSKVLLTYEQKLISKDKEIESYKAENEDLRAKLRGLIDAPVNFTEEGTLKTSMDIVKKQVG